MLIAVFIVGAIIGSFLNVVIYRYPMMLEREWNQQAKEQLHESVDSCKQSFNLCMPRSHCPRCQHPISVRHNIPLFSYLFLRGKCAYCHQKISVQYFLVESIAAISSVIVIMQLHFTIAGAAVLLLTWALIVLSFIDLKHQFLPDPIIYIFLWLGLLLSTHHIFISTENSIVGALLGYLFLWTIGKLYLLIRKQDGMGLGDCKMLAMIGAWTGAYSLLDVLIFSTVLALIVSFILLLCKKMEKSQTIPFGPYLAIAGWVVILFGAPILSWMTAWLG